MRRLVAWLRRLDDRAVPTGIGSVPWVWLVVALVAGLLAAGVPAAMVIVSGGPVLVALLLPLLGAIPVALVLLVRRA